MVRKKLSDEFGYKNVMQVPVIEKVVINMGIGEGVNDRKKVEAAANDLSLIAGQKAVITKARKSIATFKVRDGQAIGCKVTLRKTRMYEFVDRLINIALPRVRDFRGLSPKSFDGGGNFTIGIKEHIIFPEIDYDKAADVWGMDITVCTSAKTRRRGARVAERFQLPVPAVRVESSDAEIQETLMAKKSSIEKNNETAQDDQEVLPAGAPGSTSDRARQDHADGGTVRGHAQACGVAAQLVGDPHSQSLRSDRTAACVLPQAQAFAHRASGPRAPRA